MSLTWKVLYHPEVDKDLSRIGKSRAKRAIKAIAEKLLTEPETFGAPLRHGLTGLRKLRVGDVRIVYQVKKQRVEVLIIRVGKWRDGDVYKVAGLRKDKSA